MKLEMRNDGKGRQVVANFSQEEMLRRVQSAVFDLIATRLADKYVQEHGDILLHDIIDVTTLREEVADIIKSRLVDETQHGITQK